MSAPHWSASKRSEDVHWSASKRSEDAEGLQLPESIDRFFLLQLWSFLLEEGLSLDAAPDDAAPGVSVGNWLGRRRLLLPVEDSLELLRRLTGDASSSETSKPAASTSGSFPPDLFLFPPPVGDDSIRPMLWLSSKLSLSKPDVTVDMVEKDEEEEGVDCQIRW